MQRAGSVNVECVLSTCPFDVLCIGSTQCKGKPHLCAKDLGRGNARFDIGHKYVGLGKFLNIIYSFIF